MSLPKLQGRYGAVKVGDQLNNMSWGDKVADNDNHAMDNVNDFLPYRFYFY